MQIRFPGFINGNQNAIFRPRKTMLQVKQLEREHNAEEIAKKEQESAKLEISEAAKALQEYQVEQAIPNPSALRRCTLAPYVSAMDSA